MEVKEKKLTIGKNKSKEIMDLLQKGKFDDVEIRIDDWFKTGRYNYIYSLIEGCDKSFNYELLELITIYTKKMINFFMQEKNTNLKKEIIINILNKIHMPYINNGSFNDLQKTWNETNLIIIKELLDNIIRVIFNHEEYNNIIMLLKDDIDYEQFPKSVLRTDIENISLNDDEHYFFYVSNYKDVKNIDRGCFSKDNIDYWFSIHDYNIIDYALAKSKKIGDIKMINYISKKTQIQMQNTQTSIYTKDELIKLIEDTGTWPWKIEELSYEELKDYYDKRVRDRCVIILKDIIDISRENYNKSPEYKKIIDEIKKLNNDELDLYICANMDYYNYLNHPNERIRKVANIRRNFENEWQNSSDNKKERIKWIENAITFGIIEKSVKLVGYDEPDKTLAVFESSLFAKSEDINKFDEDILFTIQDPRILSSKINELINEETIQFKEEFRPLCFEKKYMNSMN